MKKLIIGLFLIYSLPIFSQELVLTDAVNEVPVGYSCEVFQDETQRFSEKDILTQHFNASNSSIPNFGYGTAAIWLKINVQNQSSQHWLLEIDNPRTNHLSVYLFQKNQLIEQIHTGDSQPFSSYLFPDRNLIFDQKMHQDESYAIYLKARGTEDLKFPMTFWEEKKLYQHLSNRNLIWGTYFGFIILISLYNFFLWLTIKDKTYLFYVCYVLVFGLLQADLYGYGFQFLWSNSFINDRGVMVFMFGSNFFMIHFLRNFWNLKISLPYWYHFSLKVSWFSGTITIISLFLYDWYCNILGVAYVMVLVLWFFYLNIRLILKKQNTAYFSFLAFSALMLATFVVVLKNFGIISAENQDYYLMVGSMIEMVLLSLALGDKFRIEQLEKERQQHLRNEIAANLHDDLAASLSSLTMFSESNRRKAQKESLANELIFSRMSERLREILNLVRENVWEMNPRNDVSEEWLDRMIQFATETLESKQIDLDLIISEEIRAFILPIAYRRNLYLFFKEAINNIAKHSEADLVKIEMDLHQKSLFLTIKDNGKGFNINKLNEGNGVENFQTRANNLKGNFELNTAIGKGTALRLWFKVTS